MGYRLCGDHGEFEKLSTKQLPNAGDHLLFPAFMVAFFPTVCDCPLSVKSPIVFLFTPNEIHPSFTLISPKFDDAYFLNNPPYIFASSLAS